MSEFEQELADYLKALRLPQAPAQKAEALCAQHDFSSARAHLIISRPGYHSGTFAFPWFDLSCHQVTMQAAVTKSCCSQAWAVRCKSR